MLCQTKECLGAIDDGDGRLEFGFKPDKEVVVMIPAAGDAVT